MKRRDIIKRLRQIAKDRGEELILVEGGRHTKASIGDRNTTIPRHNEVNEMTANSIIKHMEGKEAGE
ncbi:hypothetical protein FK530_23085 [Tsukamurella conjunctivitidis]|uniref:Type II toxin-antitoxin system HicA family toxin n=1 Tax=Tsukamurella conjunctivitidis TaxID=2592068 RepID=A0A5C5RRE7_9ACTN|nr:hypothetical protein [Tsukamurella conjunctivitidis]TWS25607.1 hypothetical protein FK530_23085 [Tsukamurella conjunctivitidis]